MITRGIHCEFEFDQNQPKKLMLVLVPKPPDIEIRRGNEFYGHAACVKGMPNCLRPIRSGQTSSAA